MTRFFIWLYRFFKAHKAVFYAILTLSFAVFGFFGLQIRFDENIIDLLPKTEESERCAVAFEDIKVKDKVMFELLSRSGSKSPEELAALMDGFIEALESNMDEGLIDNILYKFDTDDLMNLIYYGEMALPCHIPEAVYPTLDSLLRSGALEAAADGGLELPVDPSELIGNYSLANAHLMSTDGTVALAFLSPAFNTLESLTASKFDDVITGTVASYEEANPDCEILYHGAAIEGAYNSKQSKKDLFWTVGISLLIICLLICFCFKSRFTLLHLLAPIVYGTFFSLAVIYWMKGEMSLIAIGIGALVLGVALSYVLHVLTHNKFVPDVEEVLRQEAKPVCLGCITTIGAFAGLLLTSSELLHDFGIFASLALIGTTFYALAFMPQFLRKEDTEKNEKAFEFVNRINTVRLEKKKVPVIILCALIAVTAVASFFVKFDSDLSHIGYREPKMVRSEEVYNDKVNHGWMNQYFAVHSTSLDSAIVMSKALDSHLAGLKEEGLIHGYSGTGAILVPQEEQQRNIDAWKKFWTPERTLDTYDRLTRADASHHWSEAAGMNIPQEFLLLADADFEPQNIIDAGVLPESLLCNYVEEHEDEWLVLSSALLDRATLYETDGKIVDGHPEIVVMDPFYYAGDMVKIARKDFNVVLLVSSIFVFLVLLLSFKNLIIALIAFMPMFLSWYVVQGIMAIFGMQFNLINIMISTFIFGIGVDYSIFVMEGLINTAKYNTHRLIVYHKAAITFSAAALIIVLVSLIFARHPAIHSVGTSTIIGMVSTILITYALEPLMFKFAAKHSWI